jgi:hypothetical protein
VIERGHIKDPFWVFNVLWLWLNGACPGNALPFSPAALVGLPDRALGENPDDRVGLNGWNEGLPLNDGVEVDDANMETRNGFGPSDICGRSPPLRPGLPAVSFVAEPKEGIPVRCALRAPIAGILLVETPFVGLNDTFGGFKAGSPPTTFVEFTPVAGSADDGDVGDPAIGGSESNKFAPKEDDGLKGLIPPKPVCCG